MSADRNRYLRPVFTREQADLFAQFCELKPGATNVDWESVDVDEINGKRVLCLLWFPEGADSPIYCHFSPEGVTEEEQEALTRRHDMDGIYDLETRKRRRIG